MEKPHGGYFISIFLLDGCAKETIRLLKEAGVMMTSAGPHILMAAILMTATFESLLPILRWRKSVRRPICSVFVRNWRVPANCWKNKSWSFKADRRDFRSAFSPAGFDENC